MRMRRLGSAGTLVSELAQGASRGPLQRAVDARLRRLAVDVIDLYRVHCWDPVNAQQAARQGQHTAGHRRSVRLHRRDAGDRVGFAR